MTTKINIFSHQDDLSSFSAGQTIFTEGDTGNTMFAVVEGEVDSVLHGNIIETVTEGGVFGEMALIDHESRSAAAVAKTDVKVAEVDEKRFHFLVQQTPNFASQLMRILVERIRHMDEAGVDSAYLKQ